MPTSITDYLFQHDGSNAPEGFKGPHMVLISYPVMAAIICSVWDWEKPVFPSKVVIGVEMILIVGLSKTEDIIASFVSCKLLIFK